MFKPESSTIMELVDLLGCKKISELTFPKRLESICDMINKEFKRTENPDNKAILDYACACTNLLRYLDLHVAVFDTYLEVRQLMSSALFSLTNLKTVYDVAVFKSVNHKIVTMVYDFVRLYTSDFLASSVAQFSIVADNAIDSFSIRETTDVRKPTDTAIYLKVLDDISPIGTSEVVVPEVAGKGVQKETFDYTLHMIQMYQDGGCPDRDLIVVSTLRKIINYAKLVLVDIHLGLPMGDDARVFYTACVSFTNRLQKHRNTAKIVNHA